MRMGHGVRTLVVVAVLATVTACTTRYRDHGYVPSDSDLAALTVGVDTRATVLEQIGSPTASGVSAAGDLFYVESRFQLYGPLEPKEIDREIVAIRFDAQGLVSNVERFGLDNGQIVPLSRRVTRDNVRDTTFIRQLFGALGRFNAADFIGDGS